MISNHVEIRSFYRIACIAGFQLAAFSPNLFGQPTLLTGKPVDFGYESENACCIDVAAVNLLNYLDRQKGNETLIPDGKSVGEQQEDFHKRYDPDFERNEGNRNDLKKGLADTFKERGFKSLIKTFLTADLSYETLLKEWKDDELIILLARETKLGWGHALFLWGLELNAAIPKLAVIDPNLHPNTDHRINGQNTNSTGSSSWSDLTIGTDDNGFPDWRITISAPEHTYTLEDVVETWEAKTFDFRITGFISVSDVKVPDTGSSFALLGFALAVILLARRQRGLTPRIVNG